MNPFSVNSIIKELKLTVNVVNVRALPSNCAYGVLDTSYQFDTFNNVFDGQVKYAMTCV